MTEEAGLDLLGIGNAIVDVLTSTSEELLAAEGLPKGSMTLIDAERADLIYSHMGPGIEVSGGSVANSVVGAASLGSRTAYIGKVHEDDFGTVFAHDIRAAGVRFETPPATGGAPTARCLHPRHTRRPPHRCQPTSAPAWSSARRTSTRRWWRAPR